MTDPAAQAVSGDAALDAAVTRWAADPALAPIVAAADAPLLVLDAAGERVLHASAAAARLRAGIATTDGRVPAALQLAQQLRRAGGPGLRLARIRFDARGIARPTACLIASAAMETGEPVLLIAPKEPLPALRPLAPAPVPAIESASEPASVPDPDPPEPEEAALRPGPSGRFTWGSDAEGVLTRLAGAEPALTVALRGRGWRDLAEDGTLVGPELLAALEAGRTFRGVAVLLRPAATVDEIALELSGAPAGRPAQPFAGFSGFGLVRERRPRTDRAAPADAAAAMPETVPVAPQGPEPQPDPAPVGMEPEREEAPPRPTSPEPLVAEAAPPIASEAGSRAGERTADHEAGPSAAPETAGADLATVPAEQPDAAPQKADAPAETAAPAAEALPKTVQADLSTHEHAAFREIARALGARFAGDEAEPGASGKPAGGGGAVMAFPAQAAAAVPAPHPAADIDAAILAALDRLPAGVLVHRARAVLFANRRFLELAGQPDKAALQGAAGLAPLYELSAAGRPVGEPVSIGTGRGGLLALLVEHSTVDWEGGPAELLLVREATDSEPLRARIAKELAQDRDDVREREARLLLDHVEEGIAALDESGRVLSLNRSAAALLSAEPREVVGGTLADLFAPGDAAGIAEGLSEAHGSGSSRPRTVTPVATREGAGALRLRIARLPAAGPPRFFAGLGQLAGAASEPERPDRSPRGADLLAHVGREIGSPLDGILDLADGLLAEPAPPGAERLRETLRAIRAAGEQALGALDDLQNLASIEAGRVDLTFTDIALNDVISGCIAQMQPQATRERIVVRTSLSPDLRPLLADERLMRQAALNVIAEALRYTEPGGQVIVSTTNAERGEIALRVRHTGTGLTPEEIEQALRPARLASAAATGARAGARVETHGRVSLGLTLTKALVEANRGRFRIVSGKNEGTLVEMLFPPTQARSA